MNNNMLYTTLTCEGYYLRSIDHSIYKQTIDHIVHINLINTETHDVILTSSIESALFIVLMSLLDNGSTNNTNISILNEELFEQINKLKIPNTQFFLGTFDHNEHSLVPTIIINKNNQIINVNLIDNNSSMNKLNKYIGKRNIFIGQLKNKIGYIHTKKIYTDLISRWKRLTGDFVHHMDCHDLLYNYDNNNDNEKDKDKDKIEIELPLSHNRFSLITPSGNASTVTVLFSLLLINTKKMVVIASSELFSETTFNVMYFSEKMQTLFVTYVVGNDQSILDLIEEHIDAEKIIVLAESFSNPKGIKCFSNKCAAFIKRYYQNVIIIIDNTWNPIFDPYEELGADIVFGSGSKYISSGKTICGYITANKYYHDVIKTTYHILGYRVSNTVYQILEKTLPTILSRVLSASNTTKHILHYLSKCDTVINIYTTQYFINMPVIYFKTNLNEDIIKDRIGKCENIRWATSFGHKQTIIDRYQPKGYIRLSIGYEQDYKLIIADLEKILQ